MGIAMMELMQGGVCDIRLPGGAQQGDANDREAGPYFTRILSVVGPFQVDRFAAAILTVAVERSLIEPVLQETVPTEHILAQPWRCDRMLDAIRRRRAGEVPDPIVVNRVRFKGLRDQYIVVEGCHRAFAAREAGAAAMVANLTAEYICDVSQFCVQGNVLMRDCDGERWPVSKDAPWGLPVVPEAAAITPDTIYVLQGLGIRMTQAPDQPSIDRSLAALVGRPRVGPTA